MMVRYKNKIQFSISICNDKFTIQLYHSDFQFLINCIQLLNMTFRDGVVYLHESCDYDSHSKLLTIVLSSPKMLFACDKTKCDISSIVNDFNEVLTSAACALAGDDPA